MGKGNGHWKTSTECDAFAYIRALWHLWVVGIEAEVLQEDRWRRREGQRIAQEMLKSIRRPMKNHIKLESNDIHVVSDSSLDTVRTRFIAIATDGVVSYLHVHTRCPERAA